MDTRAWRRFRKNKGALIGALLVVVVSVCGVFGPGSAPHDPTTRVASLVDADGMPLGPGAVKSHLLGGDPIGRDEFSRLLYGARVSMAVAYGATAIALLIGVLVGLLSGYWGGAVDTASMRFVDVLLSMPFLLIAIVFERLLRVPNKVEPGTFRALVTELSQDNTSFFQGAAATWVDPEFLATMTVTLILGVLSWTTLARVVRTKMMELREQEFVEAARALGYSHTRIVFRHLLPNMMGPIIVIATLMVARMILAESALSFLGFGIKPPTPSWGAMLSEGRALMFGEPRLLVYPAVCISLAVFGFNLFGEGLRDAFDPKD